MPKLSLTPSLLSSLLSEVAPLVASLTSWDLGLASLNLRLLPRNRGYEEILLSRLHALGMHDFQDTTPDFVERLIEYLVEQNVLAAYTPETGEILVVHENVDDSNLDGLKLILAHELTHRGQHLNHPELFQRLDGLIKEVLLNLRVVEVDVDATYALFEQAQPIMTMLESHATYVQMTLKAQSYPQARIENHFNLATLLLRWIGAPKLAQYSAGLPQVAEAMAQGGIDELFRNV